MGKQYTRKSRSEEEEEEEIGRVTANADDYIVMTGHYFGKKAEKEKATS